MITNNNKNTVPDAKEAYSHFTKAMISSLIDGSFVKSLKLSRLPSFANVTVSPDFFNATAYTVVSTILSPTFAPTSAPTRIGNNGKQISLEALIGLIFAGIFIIAFVLVGSYFYFMTGKKVQHLLMTRWQTWSLVTPHRGRSRYLL